ncbi:DUF6049 family protein [Leucobacter salsicius]|uniref:DUF6049 family protein n=1 Tax=Leucobacter salsicius TaxID=664638 RepID=UPI000349620F|nr:DUF6049 family protein [Leucobacter salsicius]
MRIRSLIAAASSGVLSLALALGGALPKVNTTDTTDTTAASEPAPEPTLVVAPGEPVLTDPNGPLTVDALLRNPSDTELAAGELLLELSVAPVKSVDALDSPDGLTYSKLATSELGTTKAAGGPADTADMPDQTAAGTTAGDAPANGDTPALPVIDPGEQRASVEVTAAELPFTNTTAPGTYVLRASYTAEGADAPAATATTPLVWRGSGEHKIALSMIVPFVLPANVQTMPTRAQLGELTPGWDRLLTGAEAAKATLAIDPRIIAGIRSYGVNAPEAARDLLTRLEATTSPSFLLQFGDADVAAQAALGFTSLMSPSSLEFVTRFGEFEAPAGEGAANGAGSSASATDSASDPQADSSADASADAGAVDANADGANGTPDTKPSADATEGAEATVAPPTLTELLKWNGDVAAWPAEGNVDQGTIDLLKVSNIPAVVLDSGNVKHSGGPRADLPNGTVVVTDAGLGQAASQALAGTTATDQAAGLAQLAGELAVRAQAGGPGVAIGLDRAVVADVEDPERILAALAELDFVRATRVSDQEAGTAALKGAGALEDRLALLRSAANREAAVNEVGAVLEHPQYLSGYQRTRLLQLFATRYAPADAGFDAAATKYRARDAELLEGVQVISTEHTQLVGVSTSVPVQLHNSLPFDAIVKVTAEPVSAAIDVEERVFDDVRVAAEGNERVLVPVHSRVTSGVSGIVVTVSATSGNPTVFTGTLELSISTTVETVGLWVLGVGAVVLFVAGIFRSLKKRRKHAAKAAAEGSSQGDESGATEESSSSAE